MVQEFPAAVVIGAQAYVDSAGSSHNCNSIKFFNYSSIHDSFAINSEKIAASAPPPALPPQILPPLPNADRLRADLIAAMSADWSGHGAKHLN